MKIFSVHDPSLRDDTNLLHECAMASFIGGIKIGHRISLLPASLQGTAVPHHILMKLFI